MSDVIGQHHHHHQWQPATIATPNGMRAGKQCACGMQTIGGVDAHLVVAAQRFNGAIGKAMADLIKGVTDHRRHRD